MRNGIEQSRTGWKPILLSLVVLPLLSGCFKDTTQQKASSEPVLIQQYRQGSMPVPVSLSETNLPSSETLQLTLDVHAPAGSTVVFPEIASAVAPFRISAGYTEPLQILPNGKQLNRRVWMLVPALPGKTIFHPLEIRAGTLCIVTKPLVVFVSSLLPPGLDVFEIKEISAPIPLLPEQAQQRRLWKLLLSGIMAGVLLVVVIRRTQRPKLILIRPPHEIAFMALENLPEEPTARIHALNHLLREYIETRFNLPLLRKTTQEILPLLENTNIKGLSPALIQFIETGERFRFSNQIPKGFIEDSQQIVGKFIEATKKVAVCD